MDTDLQSTSGPTVFIIDSDEATRDAIFSLIQPLDIKTQGFDNAQDFLNTYNANMPGCLLLDVRLSHVNGLELQEHLKRQEKIIPIIFTSAQATLSMAVRSLKAGAVDFLEKPLDNQILLDSIQKALEIDRSNRSKRVCQENIHKHISQLSRREDEVIRMLIQGKSNKIIAHELGLSTKTVETHRAHIMRKLGVSSMAGLVWMAIKSGEYNEVPDTLPFTPPPTPQTTAQNFLSLRQA